MAPFLSLFFLVLLAAFGNSCRSSLPKGSGECQFPPQPWDGLFESQTFPQDQQKGNGIFGFWTKGPFGLPEYEYTLDEERDPRALWRDTSGRLRRDHWFFLGNRRLNVVAVNRGYVEVYLQDRGIEAWTRYDPATRNYGGGFSLIRMITEQEKRILPLLSGIGEPRHKRRRRFGTGYLLREECAGDLLVRRILWLPQGEEPFLVSEVEIINQSQRARDFEHDEVWDVNRIPLEPHLLRSGTLYPEIPTASDNLRARLNEPFLIRGIHREREARLTFQPKPGVNLPRRDRYAYTNFYPYDAFLYSFQDPPDGFATDGHSGWDLENSHVSFQEEPLPLSEAQGQVGVLVARRTLHLEPGESVVLRYAFGFTRPGEPAPVPLTFFTSSSVSFPSTEFVNNLSERTRSLVEFSAPTSFFPEDLHLRDELSRELSWHAAFLENAGGWQEYFQHFIVNQGSAYLYLHGADGAVRDFVFTLVPLIYIAPDLAREILLYSAGMRRKDIGGFAYAVGGYGYLSSAVIHFRPSDLDLFFFWGLAEYLAATGDDSILSTPEPLWPREESPPLPLRDHLHLAWQYLRDTIGIGPHGLIKLGSGDWDDSITFFAPQRSQAILYGESVANSALAAFAAPWLGAALKEKGDPRLGDELLRLGELSAHSVAKEWTGRWYRRAWFDPDHPFGDEVVFLFPNALAMIAGIPDSEQAKILKENLLRYLQASTPVSLIQFFYLAPPPGILSGATDPGSANHAITALGVWGMAKYDPREAWVQFLRNTMTRKAEAFPAIWHGVWSGPDAYYASLAPAPGETWASPVTPMKDFPVFNSNYHVGPLLGLLRLAGVEPTTVSTSSGSRLALMVCPRFPPGDLYLEFPVFTLKIRGSGYEWRYRPRMRGVLRFAFCVPATRGMVRTQDTPLETHGDLALWEGEGVPGSEILFEVSWGSP